MPTYIAFLRAINVGSHTVKMDFLKKLFEKMGFTNVETFIASGNVFFETKIKDMGSIKKKIEKELQAELGYQVATFIRTTSMLKEIFEYKAFRESDLKNEQNSLYIGFLENQPDKDSQKKVLTLSDEANEFYLNNKELYWLCGKNFSDSGISGKTLEKALGMETTIRNSTTIRKIVLKYCS
ncbi:MAG: DUF1697 domain-containing protein [Ignavibacteria bacterium]|nr:DUF1697 domain-containing protein [Ignavibacteria bacterium]